eukprot:c17981_g1_i1.p1 GENE.c17981_g1_i1~~c17981_g1_i1.p1  ORF type:complete len:161 (+),score=38.59 c17981_g1_i1:511-993(+)
MIAELIARECGIVDLDDNHDREEDTPHSDHQESVSNLSVEDYIEDPNVEDTSPATQAAILASASNSPIPASPKPSTQNTISKHNGSPNHGLHNKRRRVDSVLDKISNSFEEQKETTSSMMIMMMMEQQTSLIQSMMQQSMQFQQQTMQMVMSMVEKRQSQ